VANAASTTQHVFLSDDTSQASMKQDLEASLTAHFANEFISLRFTPDCHPEFLATWLREVRRLADSYAAIRYCCLACSASHVHLKDGTKQMKQLAFEYYSIAVTELSSLLNQSEKSVDRHDAITQSIMLLYFYEVSPDPQL
jgi:hypothetical protein